MKKSFRRMVLLLTVFTAMAATACDDDDVVITILSQGGTASSSSPVELTVTAVNRGDIRVVWGKGSSSCQLTAVVRVGLQDVEPAMPRACTEDLVEQGLDPGESRVEAFEWEGAVDLGPRVEPLPPGLYRVRGAAGSEWVSDPVQIRVVSEKAELDAGT